MTAPTSTAPAGLQHYVPRILQTWDDVHSDRFAEVEGTLISIDLVGFTALSESLGKVGKRGAEELVILLNEVFTELIAVSDDHGGDVLTFGGDALTILTNGPDHARRAVAAATAMDHVLRPPRSTPSMPDVRLAMSTGIATGSVWLFTIEPGHRDMLVTGPAVTQALRAESSAEAREILVTNETAARLPSGWTEQQPGGGLHRVRSTAVGTQASPSDGQPTPANGPDAPHDRVLGPVADLACIDLLPPKLCELVRAGLTVGEHRLTTIAFVGIEDLDEAITMGRAPQIQQQLDAWSGSLAAALSATGVHWLQADTHPGGAKLLLAAGAPTSTGDDERAMLRALRQIVDSAGDLHIRVGASRGRTFGGFVGSATSRRSYSSMGDYTNVAARLMGRAPINGILADATLVSHVGDGVDAEATEPLSLKGRSAPMHAMLVHAVHHGEQSVERHGPFVGREAELHTLRALADEAEASGRVGTVIGPAGLGKSRLVQEVLADRSHVRIVRVLADRFDSGRPFLVARLLLRRLDPRLDGPEDEVLPHVRMLLGEDQNLTPLVGDVLGLDLGSTAAAADIDPAFRLQRTAQVAAQVALAAVTGPVAAVVEDLQWSDRPSLAVLEAIARQVATAPLLLLATNRTEQPTLPEATVIALQPLPAAAAAGLARAADEDVPDRVLQKLVARADGNPLFVLELVRALDEDADDLPDSLDALVTARMDQLDAIDRLPLLDASVLGIDIPMDLLQEARGDDVPDGWAERVGDFVTTVAPGRMTFTQDIYRTAAYESLSYHRRRTLHRRTGLALERDMADGAVLALHFDRGGDDARAWKYGVISGRAAEGANAPIEAAALFSAALDHVEALAVEPGDVADVLEHRGNVHELAGAFPKALSDFDRALAMVDGEPVAHGRLQRKAALVEMRLSHKDRAMERYNDGLTAADKIADPLTRSALRATILVGQAGVAYREGRYSTGATTALTAVHEAVNGGDRPAMAHAFQLLDLSLKADGRTSPYDAWAASMFAAAGNLVGEGNALNNEGIAAYYAGRWDDALDAYRRSAEVRARAGDLLGESMSANNIGEVLSDQGQLAEAEEIFASARRDWLSIGYAIGVGIATSNLGRVAVRRGDAAAGRALLDEARVLLDEIAAAQFVIEADGRLVEADLAEGKADQAMTRLDSLAADVQGGAVPAVDVWLARLRAQTLYLLGREEDGRALLTKTAERAAADEIPYEQMWAAHLLGDRVTRNRLARQLGVVRTAVF